MTTSSESSETSEPSGIVCDLPSTRPLVARIISWHWRWPVFLGSAFLAFLLGVVAVLHAWLGADGGEPFETPNVFLGNHLRADIVFSLVSSYTLAVGLISTAQSSRALDRLRPLFRAGAREFESVRDRFFPSVGALCGAVALGGVFGALLYLSPVLAGRTMAEQVVFHSLLLMVIQFGLLGAMALITMLQSRVFYEVGRRDLEIALLDIDSLSPFASVGLMAAAAWFIGSAIASFLMVSGANAISVGLVIVATTGLGVGGLIVPSRGLHLCLREVKHSELTRIRAAIEIERARLLDESAASPATRMPGLLAYEARIEAVPEWPFDTTTLRRFGFFLLIPLVSWIGGALVERVVDAALG